MEYCIRNIVSIYLLIDKEKFMALGRKIITSIFLKNAEELWN